MKLKLSEAIELFLGSYEKETTREAYSKALTQLEGQIGGQRDIEQIVPADIIRVHNYLKNKGYSPATLQQRVKTIKTFFNWLVKMEFIETNPARVMKNKRPPRPQTREKAMTDEELQIILDYVQYRNRRDYAFILFLSDTGCRVGGAANLKQKDIDWSRNEATVTEKGDETRRVRFGSLTSVTIKRFLLWRKANEGPYVFSMDGKPIQADTLSQRVRRACYGLRRQGVNIRTLSAHSLRHRKGHQLGDARVNPAMVSTALGHTSVDTTVRYYYPDDWDSASDILDEFSVSRERKTGAK